VLETIRKVAVSTAITLAILVPLAWFWGKQIASPLLRLSSAIRQVARAPAATVAFKAPAGKDEIAELGVTFNSMVDGLREREALKEEVLASERLAAIGRLTAGIAHEINNPSGACSTRSVPTSVSVAVLLHLSTARCRYWNAG